MPTTEMPKLNITNEFKKAYPAALSEFENHSCVLESIVSTLEYDIDEMYLTKEGDVSAEGEAVKEAFLKPLQYCYDTIENEISKLQMDKLALLD